MFLIDDIFDQSSNLSQLESLERNIETSFLFRRYNRPWMGELNVFRILSIQPDLYTSQKSINKLQSLGLFGLQEHGTKIDLCIVALNLF